MYSIILGFHEFKFYTTSTDCSIFTVRIGIPLFPKASSSSLTLTSVHAKSLSLDPSSICSHGAPYLLNPVLLSRDFAALFGEPLKLALCVLLFASVSAAVLEGEPVLRKVCKAQELIEPKCKRSGMMER
jgi:hypothetical protein